MVKKKSFVLVIFLIAVISIYYLVQYYYNENNTQIITIYPDQQATKIKPQNTGGMIFSNDESTIYENLHSKGKNARKIVVQTELEEPINIIRKVSGQKSIDPIDEILVNIFELEEKSTENLDVFGFPNNNKMEIDYNATNGLNVTTINESNDSKLDHIKSVVPKTFHYKIQLGAVKSEAEALIEWDRVKKRNLKVFHNSVMVLKKVQYDNGKFFYIILEGNYPNINQAKITCKKLTNNGQSCIVVRHSN